MKISAKGRYAINLMIDLAMYDTGVPVALKDIASREEIPEKNLVPSDQEREDLWHEKSVNEVVVRVYDALNEAVLGALDSISLADMVEWQKEAIQNYCI